jgi:hypothetical protein
MRRLRPARLWRKADLQHREVQKRSRIAEAGSNMLLAPCIKFLIGTRTNRPFPPWMGVLWATVLSRAPQGSAHDDRNPCGLLGVLAQLLCPASTHWAGGAPGILSTLPGKRASLLEPIFSCVNVFIARFTVVKSRHTFKQ